jgi:D-alanyl-lipoteichoic acid acyltransferase DltB (MBOAT superfamily)
MLFVDPVFLFLFAPIVVFGFWILRSYAGITAALLWLTGCSIFFYGYEAPRLVVYLLASYSFNYLVSRRLSVKPKGWLFALAVIVNLAYLGYFKYTNFFLSNVEYLTGAHFNLSKVILPLGISFYTFQQIVYLSDAYNGHLTSLSFIKYCSINSFFPHLVAGPIIWHREIAPQLERSRSDGFDGNLASLGLLFFSVGFFKKVMIADNMAVIADTVFKLAGQQAHLSFAESWLGALAYSIQIYFDFSGYSEMAIGLALLFGIRFPINFFSPYKATSIIEFWRRWHMTMTRFFQEFVYMPLQLAATRRFASPATNYAIIIVMMLLVGIWHGAGWTWIAWGLLHGLLLCLNHLWRHAKAAFGIVDDPKSPGSFATKFLAWLLTYLVVIAGWVLFRADNFDIALRLYRAMFLLDGFSLPYQTIGLIGADLFRFLSGHGVRFDAELVQSTASTQFSALQVWSVFLLTIFAATAPNLLQMTRYYSGGRSPRSFTSPRDSLLDIDLAIDRKMWRPSRSWAAVSAIAFVASLLMILDDTTRSVFIYFNF